MVSTRRLLITTLLSAPALFLAIVLLAGLSVHTMQPERYHYSAQSQYATSLIAKIVAVPKQK